MAKLVFGMNQSLDGYVDHLEMRPSPALFRHFIEQVRGLTGSVYGRRMYEVMRYWDEDRPEWDAEERDFAAAWRSQPKWVVSRSLKSVGPNATPASPWRYDAAAWCAIQSAMLRAPAILYYAFARCRRGCRKASLAASSMTPKCIRGAAFGRKRKAWVVPLARPPGR